MSSGRIGTLVASCLEGTSRFPVTEFYNEGWMLRLVLDWLGSQPSGSGVAGLPTGSAWYSEARLPSAFLPRYRGDKLAEGHTHADGVIGDFTIGKDNLAELTLKADARTFVVIEAKMFSSLSKGTTNAPDYDQAARNVACMAEVLKRAGRKPEEMDEIGFVVVAPREQTDAGVFGDLVTRSSIETKVMARIAAYDETRASWGEEWFEPLLQVARIEPVSWESILRAIGDRDGHAGSELSAFYQTCLEYNRPPGNPGME